MATFLRILSIMLVLSILSDILHIKDVLTGGEENGHCLGKPKYSLLLPGAESLAGFIAKSAIKAAKKKAKALAKKNGIARNKQKNNGHTKNKRPSTKNEHEKADARRDREQKKKDQNKNG